MRDEIDIRPAREFAADGIAGVMDRAFSDYIAGHEPLTPELFSHFLWKEGIHPDASRVGLIGGRPLGLAMVARRGARSRLAAMGVEPAGRRRGLGAALLDSVLAAERDRGQELVLLECFEANHPAIGLYKSRGFQVSQRLYGYAGAGPAPEPAPELEPIDPTEVAAAMTAHGGPGLSWQTSGPALVHYGPPDLAFRLGPARAIVSVPGDEQMILRALVVDGSARGHGQGTRMLSALAARFPQRRWKIVQVCPEAVGVGFFERLGFERESLNQVEMRCPLDGRPL